MSQKQTRKSYFYNNTLEDELHMSMMNPHVTQNIPTRSITHKKNMTNSQRIQLQAAQHMSLQMRRLADQVFNRSV